MACTAPLRLGLGPGLPKLMSITFRSASLDLTSGVWGQDNTPTALQQILEDYWPFSRQYANLQRAGPAKDTTPRFLSRSGALSTPERGSGQSFFYFVHWRYDRWNRVVAKHRPIHATWELIDSVLKLSLKRLSAKESLAQWRTILTGFASLLMILIRQSIYRQRYVQPGCHGHISELYSSPTSRYSKCTYPMSYSAHSEIWILFVLRRTDDVHD